MAGAASYAQVVGSLFEGCMGLPLQECVKCICQQSAADTASSWLDFSVKYEPSQKFPTIETTRLNLEHA